MAQVLRIANLCKSYQITNTQKQDVLKGVNIEMDAGEFVGIVGESGCGKSTLLHILGGLDTDYTGSVVIKGKFIRDFTDKEMDDYRKKRIGLVFQNYNLISHMNVSENIEIAMEMSDIDEASRKARVLDLLRLVGLENHGDKMPNQLSGGQKQRVSIARALANNPSIILADEPTGALDNESTEQVISILKKVAELGKLVIVVTHSDKVAEECSRIVRMDDGKIVTDEARGKKLDHYVMFKENEPKNIKTKDIAKLSFRNLLANKNRSFLVSLGTSIGIAALILILALSKGLTNYVKDFYGADASSTAIIAKYSTTLDSDTIEEAEAIDGVTKVTTVHTAEASVQYKYNSDTYSDFGTIYTYMEGFAPSVIYGSLPTTSTEIMINASAAYMLDKNGMIGAIGQSIMISYASSGYSYTITGIYDDSSDDYNAYILSEAMDNYTTSKNTCYVKVTDITYLDAVKSTLKRSGFTASTFSDSASQILSYIDLGTNVLTAVAAIATVVSAIMIIIVMYISVVERTQEIGILRSIGARKKDVSNMFMIESTYLGILGGTFGVIISLVIALIANAVCKATMSARFISYNPLFYLLGFLVSVIVSTLAGIAPSNKASRLDPIEALRHE